MSKENKVLKSGIYYIIANIMLRAVSIITSPIYTRLLSPDEKALADNFNSYVSIFTTITCLCLIYSVGRAKLDFPDKFDEYMSSIQTLSSGFGVFVLIFALINVDRLSRVMLYERAEIFVMFLYLVIFPSIDYMQYKYRFEYKYKENVAISVLICIMTVILSITLILFMPKQKAFAKILGTVLPGMIVGLWCYIQLLRRGKVLYNKEYWIYALRIGLPMIPHGLALLLLARIDSIMIVNLCGAYDGGIYTTGYSIAILLSVITNAIGQAWLPWFNEKLHENNRKEISEKNTLLMYLGCFLTLGFIAVGPEVIKLLTAKTYWECMWVIPPVAIGTLCQYFYTNHVNLELYYKKTIIIAVNSIIAAVINVVLNAYFIPLYGYLSAAYTTVAGYFILMLLHLFATRIVLKEKVYRDFYYLVLLLSTSAIGMGLLMLYDRWLIRYVASVILCAVILFWRRKDVVVLVNEIKLRISKRTV